MSVTTFLCCRNSDTSYDDRGSRGRDRRRGVGRGMGRGVNRRYGNDRHAAAIAGEPGSSSVVQFGWSSVIIVVRNCDNTLTNEC